MSASGQGLDVRFRPKNGYPRQLRKAALRPIVRVRFRPPKWRITRQVAAGSGAVSGLKAPRSPSTPPYRLPHGSARTRAQESRLVQRCSQSASAGMPWAAGSRWPSTSPFSHGSTNVAATLTSTRVKASPNR
jgi:hypothetical protein